MINSTTACLPDLIIANPAEVVPCEQGLAEGSSGVIEHGALGARPTAEVALEPGAGGLDARGRVLPQRPMPGTASSAC